MNRKRRFLLQHQMCVNAALTDALIQTTLRGDCVCVYVCALKNFGIIGIRLRAGQQTRSRRTTDRERERVCDVTFYFLLNVMMLPILYIKKKNVFFFLILVCNKSQQADCMHQGVKLRIAHFLNFDFKSINILSHTDIKIKKKNKPIF